MDKLQLEFKPGLAEDAEYDADSRDQTSTRNDRAHQRLIQSSVGHTSLTTMRR